MHYRKKDTNRPGMGALPAKAPLANPYVPFQMECPPKYEARTGLVRGTLYPGLDLPFHGMVNKQPRPVTPKTELQALGFAMHELALYLDTHPCDQEALEQYRAYQKMHHEATMKYGEKIRPLTHEQPVDDREYTWLCDPWPWEFAANKED